MSRGIPGSLRLRSLLQVAAALSLWTAAKAVGAQAGVWTANGPFGGNVYCLVADPAHPGTLYSGTDQGVIKSEDAGQTWRSAATGMPPATRVQTIAIDPTATTTLYAGTVTPNGVPSIGIFKSTDGGASWTAVNNGLFDPITGFEPLDVLTLAIDPKSPSTILAGSRFSEVFKSTDGGASWQSKTLGGFNAALQTSAFQFDPTDHTRIYAASTLGLLRSTDGGENWSVVGATVSLFSLVIDPSNPSTLYAGNVTGYGLLKSTDGGSHFASFNKGLPSSGGNAPSVIALALDPSRSSTVYAGTYGSGLYASTDGASNWTRADTGLRTAYVAALALPASSGSAIYAGTLGGAVYQSSDGARTWAQTDAGIEQSLVYGVTLDPSSPDTIYAATFEGVQKSADGGATWNSANNGLPVDPVGALILLPGASKTLYAGTLGGGLFRSADGGASWAASGQGLTDSFIASIAFDPSSPSTLYAGTAHLDSSSQRVYKSTDAGATWRQTSLDAKSFTMDFIAVNPAKSTQVIAGSQGVSGYYQSTDSGNTWSAVSSSAGCGATNALLFSASGSTMYIAGSAGACRSTDGGATWTLASVGGFSLSSIAVDPTSPSTLYAGATLDPVSGASGVFRSTDGGQTWQPLGSGFPAATATSLAIDPLGKTVHAGTFHAGVVELAIEQDRPPVQEPAASNRQPRTLTTR